MTIDCPQLTEYFEAVSSVVSSNAQGLGEHKVDSPAGCELPK